MTDGDKLLEEAVESCAVKPKSGVAKKNGKVVARYGEAKENHESKITEGDVFFWFLVAVLLGGSMAITGYTVVSLL